MLKKIIFSCLAVLLGIFLTLGLLLCIDLYLHKKFSKFAGLNYRGYRGEVVGKKEPGEIRIAMVGGSSVFGYGLTHDQAMPAHLERKLNSKIFSKDHELRRFTVLNLAYNGEGAYALYYNLKDFRYLNYNIVVFYSGYNDLNPKNRFVFRHSNPIFRLSGYMPILPMCITEKLKLVKRGGKYSNPVLHNFNAKDTVKIAALEQMSHLSGGVENTLNRIWVDNQENIPDSLDQWSWFLHYMKKAIDYALTENKRVIVVLQPYFSDEHRKQQCELKKMLVANYSGNSNLGYLDLGEFLSLKDSQVCFDGLHLTSSGYELVANRIADYLKSTVD